MSRKRRFSGQRRGTLITFCFAAQKCLTTYPENCVLNTSALIRFGTCASATPVFRPTTKPSICKETHSSVLDAARYTKNRPAERPLAGRNWTAASRACVKATPSICKETHSSVLDAARYTKNRPAERPLACSSYISRH